MLLDSMPVLLSCPGSWTSDDQGAMGGLAGANGWAARFLIGIMPYLSCYHLRIIKAFPSFYRRALANIRNGNPGKDSDPGDRQRRWQPKIV